MSAIFRTDLSSYFLNFTVWNIGITLLLKLNVFLYNFNAIVFKIDVQKHDLHANL